MFCSKGGNMGRSTESAVVQYVSRLGFSAEGIVADAFRLLEEATEDAIKMNGYRIDLDEYRPLCANIYPEVIFSRGEDQVFLIDECEYHSGDYTVFANSQDVLENFLDTFGLSEEARIEENATIQQTL
jgi:hypothetical protein